MMAKQPSCFCSDMYISDGMKLHINNNVHKDWVNFLGKTCLFQDTGTINGQFYQCTIIFHLQWDNQRLQCYNSCAQEQSLLDQVSMMCKGISCAGSAVVPTMLEAELETSVTTVYEYVTDCLWIHNWLIAIITTSALNG